MEEKTIVQRIKELCDERKISIANLEKEVELSNGLVSRWDRNSPSVDKIAAVAKYLNTSIDYLVGMTDKNTQPSLKDQFVIEIIKRTNLGKLNWIQFDTIPFELTNSIKDVCILDLKFDCKIFEERTYFFEFNSNMIVLTNVFAESLVRNEILLFTVFGGKVNAQRNNITLTYHKQKLLKTLYDGVVKFYNNKTLITKENRLIQSFLYEDTAIEQIYYNKILNEYMKFSDTPLYKKYVDPVMEEDKYKKKFIKIDANIKNNGAEE